jgi:hypothetical protein
MEHYQNTGEAAALVGRHARQCDSEARQVVAAAPAFHGELLGSVRQTETDDLFAMEPTPDEAYLRPARNSSRATYLISC